jgi:2-C-methyl-D-erythritol 2,4-cyclodiphosphate synthase
MDALLGALSLGDIGHYFPPNDPKWQGADSLMLLQQVHQIISSQGWHISNIDSTVVAEQPKLKPYLKSMRDRLSQTLQIDSSQVSVKATTNEKLDSVGAEEGICAYAVVLLVKT